MLFLLGDPSSGKNVIATDDGENWVCRQIALPLQGMVAAGNTRIIVWDDKNFWNLEPLTKLQPVLNGLRSVAFSEQGQGMAVNNDGQLFWTDNIATDPFRPFRDSYWNIYNTMQVQYLGNLFFLLGSYYDPGTKQYCGGLYYQPDLKLLKPLRGTTGYQQCFSYEPKGIAVCQKNLSPTTPYSMIDVATSQKIGSVILLDLYQCAFNGVSNYLMQVNPSEYGPIDSAGFKAPSPMSKDAGKTWVASPEIIDFPATTLFFVKSLNRFFAGNAYRFSMPAAGLDSATQSKRYTCDFQLAKGPHNYAVLVTPTAAAPKALPPPVPVLYPILKEETQGNKTVFIAAGCVLAVLIVCYALYQIFKDPKPQVLPSNLQYQ